MQERKEKEKEKKRKRKEKEKKKKEEEEEKRRKEKKENAGAARSASVSGASSAGGFVGSSSWPGPVPFPWPIPSLSAGPGLVCPNLKLERSTSGGIPDRAYQGHAARGKAEGGQCGKHRLRRICAAPGGTTGAAEARRAEAIVAKRLAQRFVLGVESGRMY